MEAGKERTFNIGDRTYITTDGTPKEIYPVKIEREDQNDTNESKNG